jgi:hypothetical protein
MAESNVRLAVSGAAPTAVNRVDSRRVATLEARRFMDKIFFFSLVQSSPAKKMAGPIIVGPAIEE